MERDLSQLTDAERDAVHGCLRRDARAQRFDDMLDRTYSLSCVGDVFSTLRPSHVLKTADPIAYAVRVDEYVDDTLVDIDGIWYDRDGVCALLQSLDDDAHEEAS